MDSGTGSAETVGLRARKAAQTRLALSEALTERLSSRLLVDIPVDEIAAAAGVSRMTLFNHFATKEAMLDHLFVVGLYREQCEALRMGLTGVADIVHHLENMGRLLDQRPGVIRQVMAWYAARPVGQAPPELTRADREILAPDLAHVPLEFGRDRFPRAIAAARAAGEIDLPPAHDDSLAQMLGVLAYGLGIVGHSRRDRNWAACARHHALRALALDVDDPRYAKTTAKRAPTKPATPKKTATPRKTATPKKTEAAQGGTRR